MANTTIQLKRSGTSSNVPASLAYGELSLNYADGLLYYKNATGQIVSFSSGTNSFGTVNANGTFVVAGAPSSIVSLIPGTGIAITGDAINDIITISATGGGGSGGGNQFSTVANVGNTTVALQNLYFDLQTGGLFAYLNDGDSSQIVELGTGSGSANVTTSVDTSAANAWVNTVFGYVNTQIGVAYNKANTANIIGANASIEFVIDGAGSAITTGQKGHIEVPFNATITQCTLLADQSGSANVEIWKAPYAAFPPVAANTINSTGFLISSAAKNQITSISTTTINAGDVLAYNVATLSTITRLTVSLKVVKS